MDIQLFYKHKSHAVTAITLCFGTENWQQLKEWWREQQKYHSQIWYRVHFSAALETVWWFPLEGAVKRKVILSFLFFITPCSSQNTAWSKAQHGQTSNKLNQVLPISSVPISHYSRQNFETPWQKEQAHSFVQLQAHSCALTTQSFSLPKIKFCRSRTCEWIWLGIVSGFGYECVMSCLEHN